MINLGAFSPELVANWIVIIVCLLCGAVLYHIWLIDHPKMLIGTRVGHNFERELNGWVHGDA